jgi:hypothetical protein
MKMTVFYVTCVILAIIPLIFVYNKVYKDGVIGRIALTGISGVAILFLLDAIDTGGGSYELATLTVAGFLMFAVFLCWHLWRFHRRVVIAKPIEEDRRKCADRRLIKV